MAKTKICDFADVYGGRMSWLISHFSILDVSRFRASLLWGLEISYIRRASCTILKFDHAILWYWLAHSAAIVDVLCFFSLPNVMVFTID